ncbi:hypothetical protein HD554DRAFT_2043656 [Boletus coccyginus]|nr:hypothetical protein HD554DRAFT_2043656 [Boletus coccyginus]
MVLSRKCAISPIPLLHECVRLSPTSPSHKTQKKPGLWPNLPTRGLVQLSPTSPSHEAQKSLGSGPSVPITSSNSSLKTTRHCSLVAHLAVARDPASHRWCCKIQGSMLEGLNVRHLTPSPSFLSQSESFDFLCPELPRSYFALQCNSLPLTFDAAILFVQPQGHTVNTDITVISRAESSRLVLIVYQHTIPDPFDTISV